MAIFGQAGTMPARRHESIAVFARNKSFRGLEIGVFALYIKKYVEFQVENRLQYITLHSILVFTGTSLQDNSC
jgi:hypothetical protein